MQSALHNKQENKQTSFFSVPDLWSESIKSTEPGQPDQIQTKDLQLSSLLICFDQNTLYKPLFHGLHPCG